MVKPSVEDSDQEAPRRPRGRPRDVDVDARILRSAASVFAAEGWRGFTLEAVAKSAGIGKSTIYLRWANREDLIVDALAVHGHEWVDVDTGDVRRDLCAMALDYGRAMDDTDGPLGLRLFIETLMNPEFAAVSSTLRQGPVSVAHQVIRRAKRRGQLHRNASSAVILDGLLGGLMSHMSTVTPRVPGGLYHSTAGAVFVERLVDTLLDSQLPATES